MRKTAIFLGLFAFAFVAQGAVTVGTTPTSLVTSATSISASGEKAVFEFALSADASETLSSVEVTVNSTTATSSDLAAVSVYKDNGNGTFGAEDMQAGTNTTVNVGSATMVTTASNNTLTGGKFFVVLKTGASWSGSDNLTVTLNANGLITSANSPTTSAVTTSSIAFDLSGPMLQTAVAMNKDGGSSAVEAGDKIVLTFNEATNKPVITAVNIASTLSLNNSHVWLDGVASIGSATWNDSGTVLTITLSAGTSAPTLVVGDTVTISGSLIKDSANNNASGTATISGSFGTTPPNDDDEFGKTCASGIINGKLYKSGNNNTVYLAAGCSLRPFRGAAVFHARGHKFQNIITLSSLAGVQVSNKPALPAGGTLVKGSNATVWFVTEDGKRKGFSSENAFKRLGFNFQSVKVISDTDLQELMDDAIIDANSQHPEGAVVKCTSSSTVYMMKGNKKYAFTNPTPYLERGHTWDAIAVVDCNAFTYQEGGNINQ
jgi:hypothetical protein